ncbi:hypothetical protein I5M74_24620 [Serratia marcescens]|nr:hypothetical protein [Serratia marcescens]
MKRLTMITVTMLMAGICGFVQAGEKGEKLSVVEVEYDIKAKSGITVKAIPGVIGSDHEGSSAGLEINNGGNSAIKLAFSSEAMDRAGRVQLYSAGTEERLTATFIDSRNNPLVYDQQAWAVVTESIEADTTAFFPLKVATVYNTAPGHYHTTININMYRA